MHEKLKALADIGMSIWLDDLSRWYLDSGTLKELIAQGVTGVTTNPTIFARAISSSDYDEALANLRRRGVTDPAQAYWELVLEDVKRAAQLLHPVWEESGGADGFVSIEVDPALADDPKGTVKQAAWIVKRVEQPNIMIKVPATEAGFVAVEALAANRINVNVTLIFSRRHWEEAWDAFKRGAAKASSGPAPRSVASLFVSRLDTAVDSILDGMEKGKNLMGKAALANARSIYQLYRRTVMATGVEPPIQRLLWASTSTKNPAYPDTKYVDGLVFPHTVNTVPRKTMEAFLDHGSAEPVPDGVIEEDIKVLGELDKLGIDIESMCQDLQEKGLKAFSDSFKQAVQSVSERLK